MGLLGSLYKRLTGAANKSSKNSRRNAGSERSKKERQKPKSTGTSQHRGGSTASGNRGSSGSSSSRSSESQGSSWANRAKGTTQHRTGQTAKPQKKEQKSESWNAFAKRVTGGDKRQLTPAAKKVQQKSIEPAKKAVTGAAKLYAVDKTRMAASATEAASKKTGVRAKDRYKTTGGRDHQRVKVRDFKQSETVKKQAEGVRKKADALEKSAQKDIKKGASHFKSKAGRTIYSKGVELAPDIADYMLPYGGTAKAATKLGEKAVLKGAKALGKKTAQQRVKQLAKEATERVAKGEMTREEARRAVVKGAKKIARSQKIKSELVGNAIQDATIGTAVDLEKGKFKYQKEGKDLAKYMGESAAMNAALGVPVTAVLARTTKEEAKSAVKSAVNDFRHAEKVTKQDVKRLANLQGKTDAGAELSSAEKTEMKELRQKVKEQAQSTAEKETPISEQIKSLEAEKEREKKAAAGGVAHIKNARKAGRDKAHIAKIQEQVNAHDARQAEIDAKIRDLRKQQDVKKYVDEDDEYTKDLLRRNEGNYDEGTFTDARGNDVPDTSVRKNGVAHDAESLKKAQANVHEALNRNAAKPAKLSAAERKEVDDAIDSISNRIANGDLGSAAQDARNLAEKYGNVDREIVTERPEAVQELRDAQQYMRGITFHMPQSDGMMRSGSFKDFKEGLGGYNFHNLKLRKSTNGKARSYGVDGIWGEASDLFPEMFPKEITGTSERFERLVEVANMSPRNVHQYDRIPDEEIDDIYEDIARSIYDEAYINATNYKDMTDDIQARLKEIADDPNDPFNQMLAKSGKTEGAATPKEAPSQAPPRTKSPLTERNAGLRDREFAAGRSQMFTSLRRLFENSLIGFENQAKKMRDKDLLQQVNNVILSKNRAAAWIEGNRSGFDRTITGEGLNKIFAEHGLFGKRGAAKRADFSNYVTYKHAIDRLEEGKPVHMDEFGESTYTKEDYERFMSEIEDTYGKEELDAFSSALTDYYKDLMQYRVDTGLVSKEFADDLAKKYPNYVPTYREMDEWLSGGKTSDFAAYVDQSLRTATGGRAPIEDLYQQTVRITKDTIRDAEQNQLMNLYVKSMGLDPRGLPEGTTLEDVADTAIHASSANGAYRVTWWNNGELVTMPVDKQIAKGLREWNAQDYTRLLNASSKLSGPMKAFKGLITDYNLIFGIRNGARDMQQALVNSKDSKYFAANIPQAVASITNKNNPYMRLYQANGGKYSSFVQQNKKFAEPDAKTGVSKALDKTAGAALRKIEDANSAIEMTPRMAEFIGTLNKHAEIKLTKTGSSLKKLKADVQKEMFPGVETLSAKQVDALEDEVANRIVGMVGKDAVDEAMRNSADITLNFSRSGVIGKALNLGVVPYFNPSVQGLSKMIRMFSESKQDGAKALLNFGMKLGTITLAPAAANEILLADDPDYQNLNTRDKDSNYFIPLGDGKFIKIPKPRENAVLAEPVEYGLRYFFDKAQYGSVAEGEYSGLKDLKQFFQSGIDNIGPVNPLTDNIFSPLINTAKNKTWYGGSIETTSDVLGKMDGNLKNSQIADERTSAVAKQIGQTKIGSTTISDLTHLSPKKIDNLMDSYLGIIYDLGISQTSDVTSGNPILNQFIKDSVFSNKNGTELWAEFGKANAPETLSGKAKAAAKEALFGKTALGITKGKTLKAKDWLNQKGYDDITYSDALLKVMTEKNLSDDQKDEYRRKLKIMQNGLRRELVYGSGEVSPQMDPIRGISKLLGVDKAMKDYTYTYVDPETGEKKNQYLDAYKAFKKMQEYKDDPKKAQQRFLDLYCDIRWTNGKIGESKSFPKWMTASVLCAAGKGNNDNLAKSFGCNDDTIQRGKNYIEVGYSPKTYRQSSRVLFKAGRKLGYDYTSQMEDHDVAMALSTSKQKMTDGAYYIADAYGYTSRRMNSARCLNAKGHTLQEIHDFADKYGFNYNTDWDTVERQVAQTYKKESNEVKAAVFQVITGKTYANPFGEIGDYSMDGDTGLTNLDAKSYGGWGRRGRRRGYRRRGRGGGGGGSGSFQSWEDYVAEMFPAEKQTAAKKTEPKVTNARVSTSRARFHDNTKKSTVNDAFRKRMAAKQMVRKYPS